MLATGGMECIQRTPRPARHRTTSAARWLLAAPPGWRIGRQAGTTTAGVPLPPSSTPTCNNVALLHVSALSARSRKSAAGARRRHSPTERPSSRGGRTAGALSDLNSPPLLALRLRYSPQEPMKRSKAPYPMSAGSGQRSEAVLKPGGCGAGQAVFSGCK